jgi:hypothetical protein
MLTERNGALNTFLRHVDASGVYVMSYEGYSVEPYDQHFCVQRDVTFAASLKHCS